jgi:hypothetical protein
VGLPRGKKETHFFSSRYSFGLEWYAKHFERCPPELPVGEVCPSYFGREQARERIKLHLPDCRIICTLRQPAERLYSLYKMLTSLGMAKGEFAEFAFRPRELADFSLAYHVRGWQQQFGRENVLVLLHEDAYRDRQGYIDRACNLIGIPAIDVGQIPWAEKHVHPYTSAARSRKMARRMWRFYEHLRDHGHFRTIRLLQPVFRSWWRGGHTYLPLDPQVEKRIKMHVRPDIDALEELIGRDLSEWK